MLGFLRSNPRPLSSALLLDAEGHSCGFEPGFSLSVASLTQRQNFLPPCHGAGQIIWVQDAPNLHDHACTPKLACTPISQCPRTAVCVSAHTSLRSNFNHFSPQTRQMSFSHISMPLAQAPRAPSGDFWLAGTAFARLVYLFAARVVCVQPAC